MSLGRVELVGGTATKTANGGKKQLVAVGGKVKSKEGVTLSIGRRRLRRKKPKSRNSLLPSSLEINRLPRQNSPMFPSLPLAQTRSSNPRKSDCDASPRAPPRPLQPLLSRLYSFPDAVVAGWVGLYLSDSVGSSVPSSRIPSSSAAKER